MKTIRNRRIMNGFLYLMLCAIAGLSIAACANDDTVQPNDKEKPNDKNITATFAGSQAEATTRTRTTATHAEGQEAKVFWDAADKVYVKDDGGTFHVSGTASFLPATPVNKAKAMFSLSGGSYNTDNRLVHYTGTASGADENTVIIAAAQSQNAANDFSHLGSSGDCGTATAKGKNGAYVFTLNHKASYLCFMPRCMNIDLSRNIFLTKITVTANKPIAGKFDFSDGSLMGKTPTAGSSNTITLTTNNFSLNTQTEAIEKNGSYMVIAPGIYNLTITYDIQDPLTSVTAHVTKTLTGFNCQEGKINDITAWVDKDITNYKSKYYTWDADETKDYWYGVANPPTTDGGHSGSYPKSNTDARWYHEGTGAINPTHVAATAPNVNEMLWYAHKGMSYWDTQTIWSTMGHLYHVGVWIKKQSVIAAENATTIPAMQAAYNSIDYRVSTAYFETGSYTSTVGTPPPASLISQYFYLPALGTVANGTFYTLGSEGHYASSTAIVNNGTMHTGLHFRPDGLHVHVSFPRANGYQYFKAQ